jgi:hypothetical protein
VQNMDGDYLPSLRGLVEVCKHACCAHFRLYSLQHIGSQGLHGGSESKLTVLSNPQYAILDVGEISPRKGINEPWEINL